MLGKRSREETQNEEEMETKKLISDNQYEFGQWVTFAPCNDDASEQEEEDNNKPMTTSNNVLSPPPVAYAVKPDEFDDAEKSGNLLFWAINHAKKTCICFLRVVETTEFPDDAFWLAWEAAHPGLQTNVFCSIGFSEYEAEFDSCPFEVDVGFVLATLLKKIVVGDKTIARLHVLSKYVDTPQKNTYSDFLALTALPMKSKTSMDEFWESKLLSDTFVLLQKPDLDLVGILPRTISGFEEFYDKDLDLYDGLRIKELDRPSPLDVELFCKHVSSTQPDKVKKQYSLACNALRDKCIPPPSSDMLLSSFGLARQKDKHEELERVLCYSEGETDYLWGMRMACLMAEMREQGMYE